MVIMRADKMACFALAGNVRHHREYDLCRYTHVIEYGFVYIKMLCCIKFATHNDFDRTITFELMSDVYLIFLNAILELYRA